MSERPCIMMNKPVESALGLGIAGSALICSTVVAINWAKQEGLGTTAQTEPMQQSIPACKPWL